MCVVLTTANEKLWDIPIRPYCGLMGIKILGVEKQKDVI